MAKNMGYQPRPGARTNRGFNRPRKIRSKTKSNKRLNETYTVEQNIPSLKEVVSRTLISLHNLGNQKFGLAPYHEYFDRWLVNLQTVLTDFESSQAVTVDDQFRKERSQIFSNIELALRDKRLKEEFRAEIIRNIFSSKNILAQTEQKHTAKMKEITSKKEHTIKPLIDKVEVLQKELDGILNLRTGFLRGISKKTKAQKEEEATLRLTSAKKELDEATKYFTTEEKSLQEEYEHRKLEIFEQIANNQREIDRLETTSQIDDSLEVRRMACENLTAVVNALLKKTEPVSENMGSSS
jgi:chromosome segregation ATPase